MFLITRKFERIFGFLTLTPPAVTIGLMATSRWFVKYWYLLPIFPLTGFLLLKLVRMHKTGAYSIDWLKLRIPVMGQLIEKTIFARTTRTLGTLVAPAVPILDT